MTKEFVTGLKNLHADNFLLYFKSHAYHFNVQGNTFAQDHELLSELYSFFYEWHDLFGEQIRQLDSLPYSTLKEILHSSLLDEIVKPDDNPLNIFIHIVGDIESIQTVAQHLYAKSTSIGGYQTLIGDYLKGLSKLHWKVKATIGKSIK